MKRFLLLFSFFVVASSSYAQWNIVIENPSATKFKSFETIKKWIATTLDSKNASVKYENFEDGTIVVDGDYKDTESSLWSIKYGFISAYVSYQLEIKCEEGFVYAKFNKIVYSTKSLYGDYSLSTFVLERIRDELKVMADLEIERGQVWNIDDDFIKQYKELDSAIKDAEQKKDDNTIPKKERKKYKRFYENNEIKESVYFYIYCARIDLEYDVISKSEIGLRDIIKSIR